MNINTKDLVGKALDYAVTRALNPNFEYGEGVYLTPYSTDKNCADVLINAHGIRVSQTANVWTASLENLQGLKPITESGPTREIAAMQCFAVSRLGVKVDVPDELLYDLKK